MEAHQGAVDESGGGGATRPRSAAASASSPPQDQGDAVRAFLAASEVHFALGDDADCHENELEEFYSYVEAPIFAENRASWQEWCADHWGYEEPQGTWAGLAPGARRQVLQRLLAALDLHDPAQRLRASRALLYHLQGSFDEAESDADQMRWVRTNAEMLLELGGVDDIFAACKRACWKHDWFSGLPDYLAPDGQEPLLTPEAKAEYLEEINVEVTVHFAQLYAILEMLRGDEVLGESLMALEPPLPVFLFSLVANLREKSIKGFPVKKLVLLLWKSLLAALGGTKEIGSAKTRMRYREGLGARSKDALRSPTTPEDVRQFRAELAAKYPTLLTSRAMENLDAADELAMATRPLPGRHTHADDPAGSEVPRQDSRANAGPPALKQGKQKFQTDQNRPFVLPYTPGIAARDAAPASIQEALQLYGGHLYIDTGVWQTCCVREQLFAEMQGGAKEAPSLVHRESDAAVQALQQSLAAMQLPPTPPDGASSEADDERLRRVDEIYSAVLPEMQSAVIVLLKLMLATTTSGGTNSAYSRAVGEGIPSEKAPDPTLEDLDIVRHREILNKGISALLLLALRWFKASHVLKMEYLAQVMLDSNILLLILKIFGLQEVNQFVRWRCEVESFGLLSYCRQVSSRNASPASPQTILETAKLRVGDVWDQFPDDPPRLSHATPPDPESRAPPSSSAYSWRNFSTTANLTQILHKICKHKAHRILLLVQYKSAAILKRTLRVQHTGLQQYVLKLIKSQVPFCGRKWRQSNMRIITLIYLLCKPTLRDDWLGGGDIDAEVEASLPEEQTLRTLIQFYNQTRYAARTAVAGTGEEHGMRRTTSTASDARSESAHPLDASVAFEREAFPLGNRPTAAGTPGRYISDDAVEGYLDVYEDVLREMFDAASDPLEALAQHAADDEAQDIVPGRSPTPSATPAVHEPPATPAESLDENRNDWEHLSPREMRVLASSPNASGTSPKGARHVSWSHTDAAGIDRRVNSSPAQLRPILHWNMEDLVEDALTTEQGDEPAPPEAAPKSPLVIPEAPLPSPQPGGIDEVEHIFGA